MGSQNDLGTGLAARRGSQERPFVKFFKLHRSAPACWTPTGILLANHLPRSARRRQRPNPPAKLARMDVGFTKVITLGRPIPVLERPGTLIIPKLMRLAASQTQ